MKKLYTIIFIATSIILFSSCNDNNTISDADLGTTHFAFGTETFDFGVEIDSDNTRDIEVYSAFTTSTERVLSISTVLDETTLNPSAYTVPATVTIPANSNIGLLSINIADINISPLGEVLTIEFPAKEGEYVGDKLTINVSQLCPSGLTKVKLSLTFDSWPEEIQWKIYDSSNNVVWSGSDPHTPYAGEYSGMSGTLDLRECLPSGTYTLTCIDDYSDGGTAFDISIDGFSIASIGAADYTRTTSVTFSF